MQINFRLFSAKMPSFFPLCFLSFVHFQFYSSHSSYRQKHKGLNLAASRAKRRQLRPCFKCSYSNMSFSHTNKEKNLMGKFFKQLKHLQKFVFLICIIYGNLKKKTTEQISRIFWGFSVYWSNRIKPLKDPFSLSIVSLSRLNKQNVKNIIYFITVSAL